ncbi:hypothetical protein DL766_000410 [Monosporascus sp. MC13-8B]|uniref:Mid2 domain-containing protein n=1 Tax=Monosporascus cannonballus TaxID=155416 RepID=A0ABY0H1S7_9PEZI|nr:hypothetical protein DL762_007798 [Monosporascus cannonballus]RYP39385.1 hypothetical protein DL766_000410 [Monosporascus sp. MC13-8B]
MSRTSYAPSTATRITTVSGFVVSSTLVLEPQTTPFEQPSSCSPSIYCWSTVPGGDCAEIDRMVSTDVDILRSECYPPDYTNVFLYNEQPADLTTAAFPGDACISGWTTACSATVLGDDGSSAYPQTYCCPPGGYTCDMQWRRRECVSSLNTPTVIWIDNPTTSYGFETTTFAGFGDGEEPIRIWRSAFPLMGTEAATTNSTTTDPESASLAAGAIAGIAIGGAAAVAILAGLGIWWWRKGRRAAAGPQYQPTPPGNFEQPSQYAGYYHNKVELPTAGAEMSELPANYAQPGYVPSPVEMDAQNWHRPQN